MSKAEEAQQHLIEAQKYLKTSLLRWKPDHDSAANEFEKAANCFKTGREFEKAIKYFHKAAESYLECHQFFAAAKCNEQSAVISGKELNQWDNCIKQMERACQIFRENGVPDTAALTYDRGAKMMESHLPEAAAKFYVKASDTTMIEDRPQHASEYAAKAAKLYVKLKKYPEAIQVLSKILTYHQHNDVQEIRAACSKIVVHIILLYIAQNDTIAASRIFNDCAGYLQAEERYTLGKILDGFDQMDYKQTIEALAHPFIVNLDNEYSKLARSIQEEQKIKLKELEAKQATGEANEMEHNYML